MSSVKTLDIALYYIGSESKYITKLNKNNACIYNYTGVYYFLSERGNDR